MKNLKHGDIQSYYNSLHKNGKSTSVIKKINKLVVPSIRHAAMTGEVIRDFSKLVVIPKDQNNEPKPLEIRPFTKEEQKIFEASIKNEPLSPLYLTALYSGIRQGELLALQWQDIDLKSKQIRVNKTYKVIKNIDTKKKRYRRATKNFCKHPGCFNPNSFGWLFKGIQTKNIRKNLKKVLGNCGIEDRRFHDLRHTYATRIFELGENAKTIQTILGHTDISVTLNTYTHVEESVSASAAERDKVQ